MYNNQVTDYLKKSLA